MFGRGSAPHPDAVVPALQPGLAQRRPWLVRTGSWAGSGGGRERDDMGHFGFSYVGLLYLLMLFLPNIWWTKRQPSGYDPGGESPLLRWMERIGQVAVTTFALIFSDFNWHRFTPWNLWLLASFLLMVLYELYWIRYFRSGRTLADFYGPFCGIPVPGASLPVASFLLLSVYGQVIWMAAAAVLLGVGHIGIHLQHLRQSR